MFYRHIRHTIVALLALTSLTFVSASAFAKASIKDFGMLPDIREMVLSPKGERVAIAKEIGEETALVIIDLNSKQPIGGTRLEKMKFRGMTFIDENLLFFRGSETTRLSYRIKTAEIGAGMVYDVARDKTIVLLGKEDRLQPFSSASGIDHIDRDKKLVFMSAREGLWGGSENPINLYRVDAKTGKGKRHKRGNQHTTGWFIGKDNKVVGRTDYHGAKQEFRIYSYLSGKEQMVFSVERLRAIDISSYVMSQDENTVYVDDGDDAYGISLIDGSKSNVPNLRTDQIFGGYSSNDKGHLDGIFYDGIRPWVEYFDKDLNDARQRIRDTFPGDTTYFSKPDGTTTKAIVEVAGSNAPGDYFLFDTANPALARLGSQYPGIRADDIGQVQSIEYEARDGLEINAVLTWPASAKTAESRKNLPLIVLPHGGPEAHDTVGFDWWSQFLAHNGYLVLQPNFRGSTGFGKEFTEKGHGKWGREMQDDVSDGVLKMIEAGYADKDRVCIMGASYGGYAAMAGGAFTPELYKCIVAVAGVSDLVRMQQETKTGAGKKHWIVRHWNKLMGEEKASKSPINFAKNFTAPTLLVHGVDDTVVPIVQSRIMQKALKREGKQSELVELKGEDHWLSRSSTRLELLQVIEKFLDKHNPA